MKATLFASLLALAALPMCKPDTAKTATDAAARNPASPTEVRAQLDILRDSTTASWQRMMTSDDQKLTDLRELLQDLSKYPGANQTQLASLRQARAGIQAQRYDQQTMASSARIDRYDAVQDSVLKLVYPIAAPDGNAPSERIRDYVEHIQLADANVVRYRAHYDATAKVYNAYLRLHQPELSKLGAKYAGLQPLPLFEVSP